MRFYNREIILPGHLFVVLVDEQCVQQCMHCGVVIFEKSEKRTTHRAGVYSSIEEILLCRSGYFFGRVLVQ